MELLTIDQTSWPSFFNESSLRQFFPVPLNTDVSNVAHFSGGTSGGQSVSDGAAKVTVKANEKVPALVVVKAEQDVLMAQVEVIDFT